MKVYENSDSNLPEPSEDEYERLLQLAKLDMAKRKVKRAETSKNITEKNLKLPSKSASLSANTYTAYDENSTVFDQDLSANTPEGPLVDQKYLQKHISKKNTINSIPELLISTSSSKASKRSGSLFLPQPESPPLVISSAHTKLLVPIKSRKTGFRSSRGNSNSRSPSENFGGWSKSRSRSRSRTPVPSQRSVVDENGKAIVIDNPDDLAAVFETLGLSLPEIETEALSKRATIHFDSNDEEVSFSKKSTLSRKTINRRSITIQTHTQSIPSEIVTDKMGTLGRMKSNRKSTILKIPKDYQVENDKEVSRKNTLQRKTVNRISTILKPSSEYLIDDENFVESFSKKDSLRRRTINRKSTISKRATVNLYDDDDDNDEFFDPENSWADIEDETKPNRKSTFSRRISTHKQFDSFNPSLSRGTLPRHAGTLRRPTTIRRSDSPTNQAPIRNLTLSRTPVAGQSRPTVRVALEREATQQNLEILEQLTVPEIQNADLLSPSTDSSSFNNFKRFQSPSPIRLTKRFSNSQSQSIVFVVDDEFVTESINLNEKTLSQNLSTQDKDGYLDLGNDCDSGIRLTSGKSVRLKVTESPEILQRKQTIQFVIGDDNTLARRKTTRMGKRMSTLRRKTIRKDVDSDSDGDFFDAEDLPSPTRSPSPSRGRIMRKHLSIHSLNRSHSSTRSLSRSGNIETVIHVSRTFYELLASRAGEAISHVGNAAQVAALPVGFVAGPAVAGMFSSGGAMAAAAGGAVVRKFGRRTTQQRVIASSQEFEKYTATKLLETATKAFVGEEFAETKAMKALSQGMGSALEGGLMAAGASLIISGVAANMDKKVSHQLLQNSYVKVAVEAAGHLGNVAPILLPKSMHSIADAAGLVSTSAGGAFAVDDDSEGWDTTSSGDDSTDEFDEESAEQ
ncbi:hypothetical protein HK096_009606 [Nowakowskiella sp. JEL0078]|nr:hypothetical protein HK096_009606 [Nowakowskiella sp. JEL0078]